MSRKQQRGGGTATADPASLRQRVQRAIFERRFQNALELARTLWKNLPEPAHRTLLVEAALGRADQLLENKYHRDAAAVLATIAGQVETDEQRQRLAQLLAGCGEPAQAMRIAQDLATPELNAQLLNVTADNAIRGRLPSTAGLPADFAGHRDSVLKAFTAMAAGQDDDARAALQPIGLTSPFLDWKVLLRGFLAYYQSDDAKALENWQRLQPERLPARLAAPFRMAIDAAYRQAQPQELQIRLRAQLENFQGASQADRLREAQRMLANDRQIAKGLRLLEGLLPAMKAESPHFVSRLAACAFWAVVDHGMPEDVDRYRRVFGAPPEDPESYRMQALARERHGLWHEAHSSWLAYEKVLATHAAALPPGHAARMRAMVWRHMGTNAATVPEEELFSPFGPMGREFGVGAKPPELKPTAEECFKQSIQLAPDDLANHLALLTYYVEEAKADKALQAGKKLLKEFPDNTNALAIVAKLCMKKADYAAAVEYLGRAVQANPLDIRLRRQLCGAWSGCGLQALTNRDFGAARAAYQSALALCEPGSRAPSLCHAAVCELVAGDAARAEELLAQACAVPHQQLAVAYCMLTQVAIRKLDKSLKKRFEAQFAEALAAPITGAAAAAAAEQVVVLKLAGAKYVGQKGHEKKVLAYLDRAQFAEFTDTQMELLCLTLQQLGSVKLLCKFFKRGQELFPDNPTYYLVEVDYMLGQKRQRLQTWIAEQLLGKASKAASKLPPERREAVLDEIEQRLEEVRKRNPFGRLLEAFGGEPFNPFRGDGDDDDEFVDDWSDD